MEIKNTECVVINVAKPEHAEYARKWFEDNKKQYLFMPADVQLLTSIQDNLNKARLDTSVEYQVVIHISAALTQLHVSTKETNTGQPSGVQSFNGTTNQQSTSIVDDCLDALSNAGNVTVDTVEAIADGIGAVAGGLVRGIGSILD